MLLGCWRVGFLDAYHRMSMSLVFDWVGELRRGFDGPRCLALCFSRRARRPLRVRVIDHAMGGRC